MMDGLTGRLLKGTCSFAAGTVLVLACWVTLDSRKHDGDPKRVNPPIGVPALVQFDGLPWRYERPATAMVMFEVFRGHEYRSETQALKAFRLIDVQARPNALTPYRRIRRMEWLNPRGQFLKSGVEECWLDDGEYWVTNYEMDALHGSRKLYYPSGRPKMEEQYARGVQEGIARGWDETGKLRYEVLYRNGEEAEVLKSFQADLPNVR